MTIFSFYCPACGESSRTEPDTYELAPGTHSQQCPNCLERFVVEIEYITLDDDSHLRKASVKMNIGTVGPGATVVGAKIDRIG